MIPFEANLCECKVLHDGDRNDFRDLNLHYKILGEAISHQDLCLGYRVAVVTDGGLPS